MSEKDALSGMELKTSGLFVKIKEGEPQTLRILTLDPLVNLDQWGNTRYSFVVWNWTEDKAQILSKGPGIIKQLQSIHVDNDFEPLNKLDIKISATGEGLETRYTVTPLPKAKEITAAMVAEAQKIKLEEAVKNGIRLSAVNEGEELPEPDEGSGYQKARAVANKIKGEETVVEDIGDDPIDLGDIPF